MCRSSRLLSLGRSRTQHCACLSSALDASREKIIFVHALHARVGLDLGPRCGASSRLPSCSPEREATMRKMIGLLMAVAALAGGDAASAQTVRPGTPSILRWTLEQQTEWYPAIETVYPTATVKRGDYVRPLPKADRTIDNLTYSQGEKSWTVDDYMKAYNVSGVIVVKDGKILLERYGLGRKPVDRWISFSVTKSITSTLVGAAIQDGKIKSVDDAVTQYIPQLAGSAYDGVTVRQLLTT